MSGRRCRWLAAGLAVVAAMGLALTVAPGLGCLNRALDRRALRTMAAVAATGGTARGPLPFTTEPELESLTRPRSPLVPERRPLARHRRSEPELIQEELVFASAISVAHTVSNQAHAYVYRQGPLGARPVVLWVPGQYLIDLAFVPIGWFVDVLLSRGVDVVVYVPPYHLDRTPPGFASGDAVLATDLADQLAVFAQELADLRALAAWLRAQRPPALGGFGGSFGGLALLRVVGWDRSLDFLTVMMPPIRLDRLLLDAPESEAGRERLRREGRSLEEVGRLYRLLDPTGARPRIPPGRIAALYGRHDLVAPARELEAWADAWDVKRRRRFDRGHVLLLLTPGLYRAYAELLDEDLAAMQGAARAP